MADENAFMLRAFGMGIFITCVYDGLRILRRIFVHNGFWVAVEDLLFWLFCAAQVFGLMYRMSNGTLRWFAVLGALAGMWLYHRLLSPYLVTYVSRLGNLLKSMIQRLLIILLKPVVFTGKAAATTMARGRSMARRVGFSIKKRLTVLHKVLKMNITKK